MNATILVAVRVALFAAVAGCVAWPPSLAAQSSARKIILVLHTYGQGTPFRTTFDRTLQQTLQRRGFTETDFHVEALESNRFPGDGHGRVFREYIKQKYANRKIDVVITVWDRALNYALQQREELFPEAPLVALLQQRRTLSSDLPIAQVTVANTVGDTARLALLLHPDARRIAVVDGTLQSNDGVHELITEQLAPLAARVTIEYLRDLPVNEVVERVKRLPDNSLIFHARQSLRTPTQAMGNIEALERIVAAARVPIYTSNDQLVGQGVVGGVVSKTEDLAEAVGSSAIHMLNGGHAVSPAETRSVPMFDWRQLRRWGIDVARLPAGSDVQFREYTFWEQNRAYVVGAATVFLIQSCLIAGLLLQRSRRRRAESALRANEQALQSSQEDTRRLAGRLIAAQEVERARIARELHDDISQKVALLAIDITQIGLSEAPGVRKKASIMAERAAEIGTDLHNISHELHPAKLQMLGLVKATQFLCRDLAGRHRLDIDFVHDHMPQSVPPESALCLFRIAQEALQNVVKHSGARNAAVELTGSADSLRLEISDSGGGFDTSKLGKGMGLLSMRERVNFLDGHITIRSTRGGGTSIAVRVPISQQARPAADRAARTA